MVEGVGDGIVRIVEPCGSDAPSEPSVLWFCMDSLGQCNTCSFAPYQTPPLPLGPTYPNPNQRTTSGHANVTRRWTSPQTFYVNMPNGTASAGVDIFTPSLTQAYTYGEFAWDVCFAMARYGAIANWPTHPSLPSAAYLAANPGFTQVHPCLQNTPATIGTKYSAMYMRFGGVSGPAGAPGINAVTRSYASAAFTPLGNIFPFNAATPNSTGPTGDGINEIIFFPNPMNNFIGLTSMLMRPTSGVIIECDVLLSARYATWPLRQSLGCPSGVPTTCPGGPGWTTAITHEIGHLFGLDHTNLHPGLGPGAFGTPCVPNPAGNVPSTVPGLTTPFVFTSYT